MNQLKAVFREYALQFISPMGTSRGRLHQRTIYLIQAKDGAGNLGVGECAPVPGLSPDHQPDLVGKLQWICKELNRGVPLNKLELTSWPAIKFALEMVILDLRNGGKGLYFDSAFTQGHETIATNGLIHMGSVETMRAQLLQKVKAGFKCIKIKVGALDFETELAFLQEARGICPAGKYELRLDANGAFESETAMNKLEQLARFDIHSIEQPLRPGQGADLAEICRNSPIPVALDEELIGVVTTEKQQALLELLQPQYIVLKPTLLGGFSAAKKWIDMAASLGIDYWISSILESNVGLSAIAQWTSILPTNHIQGLGTGQLFSKNFITDISLKEGALRLSTEAPLKKTVSLSSLEPV